MIDWREQPVVPHREAAIAKLLGKANSLAISQRTQRTQRITTQPSPSSARLHAGASPDAQAIGTPKTARAEATTPLIAPLAASLTEDE